MFGNKFSGDEIAREFQRRMHTFKKEASMESPEDFLVAPPEEQEAGDSELSAQIDSVSSYADDSCDKCGEAHDGACGMANDADDSDEQDESCEKCGEAHDGMCGMENDAYDYYIDRNAEFVLTELGKMAGRLRSEKQAFAADMVEATAMSIKDDLVKEASQKMRVVSGLEKMAKDMYGQGDNFSGDLIKATLDQLKKY